MTAPPLTAAQRDTLVARMLELDGRLYPAEGSRKLTARARHLATEELLLAVGEYFDRLPRMVLSACPFCGAPLVRAFDPWGVDGPWWGTEEMCDYEEPEPCAHFRVLLGALCIDEQAVPAQMLVESMPGPEVPFVVPRLLGLPNMIAMVGEIAVRDGRAYPIAYFSDAPPVEPTELHQPWCRTALWFASGGGDGWTVANDLWDFELDPYVQAETLRWVILGPDETKPIVRRTTVDGPCPFVGLPGKHLRQVIEEGARDYIDLPDGEVPDPFGDSED
jgi:hypothetical protein